MNLNCHLTYLAAAIKQRQKILKKLKKTNKQTKPRTATLWKQSRCMLDCI